MIDNDNSITTEDANSPRATAHPARWVLPFMLLAFACNGNQPGKGDGDGDTIGDGDGDGDTIGDGDGEPGDGDGEPGDGDGDSEPGGFEELRSDKLHDDNPQLTSGEAETLAAANHALTLDLYHALRDGEAAGDGFSISAYSISSAFGMLYAGSLEPAHSEIAQTLHFDLDGEQQHVAHNWLDAELENRNIPAQESGDGDASFDAVALKTANGLWMLDEYADGVSSDFLDLLAVHYDAGLKLADFETDPELEREAINAWVSERTNDLIPELFPPASIAKATTLILVNTLYLKAPWAEPFVALTEAADFTRLDDQVVEVEMMRAPTLFQASHVATPAYQAASLPLRGWDLEFVVIMPEDFAAFEAALDPAKLTEVLDSLEASTLDLRMPRLELEAKFELSSELQELGMLAPFTDNASFDAIHEKINELYVVVHNTVLKLDEDGIEAAAATGVGGDGDGDDDPGTEVMVVDRPFLLAIRDKPTNTLLFFGRVLDPSL